MTSDNSESKIIARLFPDRPPSRRFGLRSGKVKGSTRTKARLTHLDEGELWRDMLNIPDDAVSID